ncbi:hypothetical protein BJY52DRAFT_1417045 [Lactarius psammicola]|nr:hypothetical protein BJY52DRAFT_1417045 [Lactarius psammicola]
MSQGLSESEIDERRARFGYNESKRHATRVGAFILPYVVPESIPSDEGKAFCMMGHRETPSSSGQYLHIFRPIFRAGPFGAANAAGVTYLPLGSVYAPIIE